MVLINPPTKGPKNVPNEYADINNPDAISPTFDKYSG